MDKKKVLIIIFAIILAIIVAIFINSKRPVVAPENMMDISEDVVQESVVVESSEELEEESAEPSKEESFKKKNEITKTSNKPSAIGEETPVLKKIEVKEVSEQVEEAGVIFEDPGIINENGTIVVTREFKIKSPRKYSFKDFGVLAEPPIK